MKSVNGLQFLFFAILSMLAALTVFVFIGCLSTMSVADAATFAGIFAIASVLGGSLMTFLLYTAVKRLASAETKALAKQAKADGERGVGVDLFGF